MQVFDTFFCSLFVMFTKSRTTTLFLFFFFNDTATPEISPLPLHDAFPILTEFPDRFNKLEAVILAPFSSIAPSDLPADALDPSTARPAPVREGQTFRPPKQPTSFPKIGRAHV